MSSRSIAHDEQPQAAASAEKSPSRAGARAEPGWEALRFAVPLGRLLFAIIFIQGGFFHFSPAAIAYARAQDVPFAVVAVPLSGLMALVGGLSVLLGYKTRWGAMLLVLFLVPVTLLMHQFWRVEDPMAAAVQQAMFLKNLAMLGGAFLIAYFGAGPGSVDDYLQRRAAAEPPSQPAA
jgi:putative oxidoreductase